MKEQCEHSWVAYGTSLSPPRILCRCVNCGQPGIISEFTRQEWERAFYAPSDPHRVYRVEALGQGMLE